MSLYHSGHPDISVILASLSGAFVYILTQHRFDKTKQPVVFLVSFTMGVIGADATLEIIKEMFPAVFHDERAIAAFICSSLVVTVIINIISYFDKVLKKRGHEEKN